MEFLINGVKDRTVYVRHASLILSFRVVNGLNGDHHIQPPRYVQIDPWRLPELKDLVISAFLDERKRTSFKEAAQCMVN